MKKTFLIFVVLWMVYGVTSAQAQVKYCMNFSEFAANQWEQADGVSVEPISAAKRRIVQSSDFRISSSDKKLEKKFNKEVFAVMDGETLYVNCRNFRYQGTHFGPGYAYGFRYDGDKLIIANRKIGTGVLMLAGLTGVVPSAPGIIVAYGVTEIQLADKVCYLVDSEAEKNGKTKIKYVDDQYMKEVLVDKEEVRKQYDAAGDKYGRQSAANIIQTLMAAGLITKGD